MELLEEMVALEHLHTHHGQQQHLLVEVAPTQEVAVEDLQEFNIQQQQALVEEHLAVGD